MRNSLVIFDIDGTLIDSVKIDGYGFIQTYKELFGIDLGEADWTKFSHVTDWGLSNSIFEQFMGRLPTEAELESVREHFLNILVSQSGDDHSLLQEIPGAVDFFHFLKEIGAPLAIATGGWAATASFKLDQIGLKFHDVSFANSNHHYSRKVITQHAIDMAKAQHQTEFQRIIYFGDGK
ncbi:HAD family hydrolase, partial [bacterium]|nr:HAD family hydrolase [bacterium]